MSAISHQVNMSWYRPMLVGEKTPNGPIQRANAHFLISRSLPFLARSDRERRAPDVGSWEKLTWARHEFWASEEAFALFCRPGKRLFGAQKMGGPRERRRADA